MTIQNNPANEWASEFGAEYTERNKETREVQERAHQFWNRALRSLDWGELPTGKIGRIFEFGANLGANLAVLKFAMPDVQIAASEINPLAIEYLNKRLATWGGTLYPGDFTNAPVPAAWADLAFTKGVLIHIHPERLEDAYTKIHATSKRWILLAEYYSPKPVMIPYRGKDNMLWKRDFAGEMMDRFPLKLIDYGFVYHRDPYPQDDITWFLMEKTGA